MRYGARANWSAASRSRCCFPDVLVQHKPGCLKQMIDAYNAAEQNANVIAVEEVPMDRISAYGVVGVGQTKGKTFAITDMVEKPPREKAPSNLIITGRYILQPEIFDLLATQTGGAGGEIQITDSMIKLAKTQPFYGLKFEGKSFDCGSKIGFLSPPMSPMRWNVRTSRRRSAKRSRNCWAIRAPTSSPRRCCRRTSAHSTSLADKARRHPVGNHRRRMRPEIDRRAGAEGVAAS